MTGTMIKTQETGAEIADGHSFADQIGQLVTNKYQQPFGTTTYSKRRVMAGVVLSFNNTDFEVSKNIFLSFFFKSKSESLKIQGGAVKLTWYFLENVNDTAPPCKMNTI